MQGTCIWQIYWKGLVDKDNKLVAPGGAIELRAPSPFLALGELARALCQIFSGDCRFIENGFSIRKIEDNPITKTGEGLTEDVFPKIFSLYNKN